MSDLTDALAAANAPLTDPEMNRTIGTAPRFELYHFALSLCSQKVRLALIETESAFVAHDINLSMPQLANYDPAYVKLRLRGGEGRRLVDGYTGRSSTDTEGFDPAVVPTLVDLAEERVVVDSLAICRYIDARTGRRLVPAELETAVATELAVVDGTPHVALFYGAHPDGDVRPERLRRGMPGVHDRKIAKIERARELAKDDPELVAAFDAKIAKERAARTFVGTPEAMRHATRETLDLVGALDERLADGRPWVCGERFTLADVFWTVSLFRLAWLGMAFAWDGDHALNAIARPYVAAYAHRLFARPAFREAAIDWPRTARSEHVASWYGPRGD
ncbi:MAG: glutathione S-transferase family protein [Myxococcota bacterium]